MNLERSSQRNGVFDPAGFTRTDLVATLAVVAVFAMLLPATGRINSHSPAVQMESNLRQLTAAWTMYANDSRDKLVSNAERAEQPVTSNDVSNPDFLVGGRFAQWCPGTMQSFMCSNSAFIKIGLLYPYVQSISVYKDPSDHYRYPNNASFGFEHCRSVTLNCWLGPLPGKSWNDGGTGTGHFHVFDKLSTIDQPGGPSHLFVFLEENPAFIDDGFLVCDPSQSNKWINVPAAYHAGGSAVSFADGHVITRYWSDPVVLKARSFQDSFTSSSDDLHWLQERSTYRDTP